MNINTFRDAVQSRKGALVNEVQDDDDDEREVAMMRRPVEGEEEDGKEKFTEEGVPIEPFNLKNEREGGYFDENENYVFKKEIGEVDAWVAGLDEQTIEAAIGEAAAAEKRRLAKRDLDEARIEQKKKSAADLKAEMLTYLVPGETISGCLRRLSGRSGGQVDLKGARRKPGQKEQDIQNDKQKQQSIAKQNKQYIERLTEIADQLIAQGVSGIYGMSYEAIQASTILWEYKALDGNIYGPYTSQQISEWKSQGFLTGATSVPIRKVQAGRQAKIDSIYDDDEEDDSFSQGPNLKRAKVDSTVTNYDEWKNSDDIDFGEFIDLNDYDSSHQRKTAFHNLHKEEGEDDDDNSDTDVVLSSRRRKRGSVEHDEDD